MKKILYLLIPVLFLLYACSESTNENIPEIESSSESYSSAEFFDVLTKSSNRKVERLEHNSVTARTEEGCDGYVDAEILCTVLTISDVISVPPYCNFVSVSYTIRICSDIWNNHPTNFIITNFEAEALDGPDGLGCADFIDYLNSLPFIERTETFEAFQYAAGLVVENSLATDWGSSVTKGTLQFSFYRDLCYQWFTITSGGNGKGGESYSSIGIEKVLCGTQCCLRQTEYVIDHGISTPGDPSFTTEGECEVNGPFGDCMNECGPIE